MIIHNDIHQYQKNKRLEVDLKQILIELEELHRLVLGDKTIRYNAYLEAPADYLINQYWKSYCKDLPKHLNKQNVIQSHTGVNVSQADALHNKWLQIVKQMNPGCIPTININTVEYNTTNRKFDKELDKQKETHYNALKTFLNAYEELNKIESLNGLGFMPRITNNIMVQNMKLMIRNEAFIK